MQFIFKLIILTISVIFLSGFGLPFGGFDDGDRVIVIPNEPGTAYIEATVVGSGDGKVTVEIDNIRNGKIYGVRIGELKQFNEDLAHDSNSGLTIATARSDFFSYFNSLKNNYELRNSLFLKYGMDLDKINKMYSDAETAELEEWLPAISYLSDVAKFHNEHPSPTNSLSQYEDFIDDYVGLLDEYKESSNKKLIVDFISATTETLTFKLPELPKINKDNPEKWRNACLERFRSFLPIERMKFKAYLETSPSGKYSKAYKAELAKSTSPENAFQEDYDNAFIAALKEEVFESKKFKTFESKLQNGSATKAMFEDMEADIKRLMSKYKSISPEAAKRLEGQIQKDRENLYAFIDKKERTASLFNSLSGSRWYSLTSQRSVASRKWGEVYEFGEVSNGRIQAKLRFYGYEEVANLQGRLENGNLTMTCDSIVGPNPDNVYCENYSLTVKLDKTNMSGSWRYSGGKWRPDGGDISMHKITSDFEAKTKEALKAVTSKSWTGVVYQGRNQYKTSIKFSPSDSPTLLKGVLKYPEHNVSLKIQAGIDGQGNLFARCLEISNPDWYCQYMYYRLKLNGDKIEGKWDYRVTEEDKVVLGVKP